MPTSLHRLFSSLTSDLLLAPVPSPALDSHCALCSQHSASKFTSLSFYPKRRERPGWQEERGKPTAEPVLGREGTPREEGLEGRGGGVFWKRRRLFLSQERREHCLKPWPSWGCATPRSPTSNGLCVCLSHGADSGFKSLLSAPWPAPVPFPSPTILGCPHSALQHPPPRLGPVRRSSTRLSLPSLPKTPKPPPLPPQASYPGILLPTFALQTLPA